MQRLGFSTLANYKIRLNGNRLPVNGSGLNPDGGFQPRWRLISNQAKLKATISLSISLTATCINTMIDLQNIRSFTIDPPADSVFGNAKDFEGLPATHQAQILFLDAAASDYIWSFSSAAHLVTGGFWAPFEKGNFKEVDEFPGFRCTEESYGRLKKWLYKRGLPFDSWVFVLEESTDQVILTTWKMIIKYNADLFRINDMMIFDGTLNWCLIFFHEDKLFFGRHNVYDATADNLRMEELNERKKKFPQFKHPYL